MNLTKLPKMIQDLTEIARYLHELYHDTGMRKEVETTGHTSVITLNYRDITVAFQVFMDNHETPQIPEETEEEDEEEE